MSVLANGRTAARWKEGDTQMKKTHSTSVGLTWCSLHARAASISSHPIAAREVGITGSFHIGAGARWWHGEGLWEGRCGVVGAAWTAGCQHAATVL